jgi:hypothetical protein
MQEKITSVSKLEKIVKRYLSQDFPIVTKNYISYVVKNLETSMLYLSDFNKEVSKSKLLEVVKAAPFCGVTKVYVPSSGRDHCSNINKAQRNTIFLGAVLYLVENYTEIDTSILSISITDLSVVITVKSKLNQLQGE